MSAMAATAGDIEALLDGVQREVEEKKLERRTSDARENDSRRDDRHRDRNYGRRDRSRDRPRGNRHNSRDRDLQRRDGSRPRSSKGADTDEENHRSTRRNDSRERHYRGAPRRDRVNGGDYYSGGGRPRSRSPRRDRDDRNRGGVRDRSRDRRGGGHDDRRTNRRSKTASPEATEESRDKRTIFVQQISQRAETRHLRVFFEAVGPVVEAQIVKDRVTGRSKGVGYVEFKDEESVPKALELTGQKLKGVPIIAQLTEAEKNRAARPSEGGVAPGANGAPFHRLYVGNIHFSVSEPDLKEIFEPYGELEQVILQRDEANPGRSKGYGFVQFVDPSNAKNALSEMNGFELAGRQIRVGLGNDKFTPESTASLLRTFNQQSQSYQGSAFSGAGGRGAYAGGAGGVFDRTHSKDDRGVGGASALDDNDVLGVNYKSYDRSKLMNALARRDDPEGASLNPQPTLSKARAPAPEKFTASKGIKIENAFDADQEHAQFGSSWVKDLELEVKAECNKKYGNVVHIAVDPNTDGEIYVKFDSLAGGQKAYQGLNGRNFNNRIIRASNVVDKIYHSLWGH